MPKPRFGSNCIYFLFFVGFFSCWVSLKVGSVRREAQEFAHDGGEGVEQGLPVAAGGLAAEQRGLAVRRVEVEMILGDVYSYCTRWPGSLYTPSC